jgi:formylglycine-generating enzyme required for sulfatase activity
MAVAGLTHASAGKRMAAAGAQGVAACPRGTVFVPGGSFNMGPPGEAGTFAQVADLCVDKTEVTVAAYRACVKADRCDALSKTIRAPRFSLSERDEKKVSKRCNARRKGGGEPANCVDFDAAARFCESQKKRLPSEQEWEWVARGGAEARLYPWGDALPGARACWNGRGNSSGKGRRRKTCPAGRLGKGKSAHGILDLAGNVWEWTSTPTGDGAYVIRGGSWSDENPAELTAARRGSAPAQDRIDILGFRCVRDTGTGPSMATADAKADVKDDDSMHNVALKPRIALPQRTLAHCSGASKECPPCMMLVRGGQFPLGGKHGPTVRVPDTCVDVTEVTTRTYADCVEAGGCLWPVAQMCRANPLAKTDHPMNCVTFDQARTFCRAIGKDLPTEAQWEWIARGGAEARTFPWGEAQPNEQLCWRRAKDEETIQVEGDSSASVLKLGDAKPVAASNVTNASVSQGAANVDEGTCPVARHDAGKSLHGIYDLAGNVWEWTRTRDPADPRARTLRGGSWENTDKIHVSAIGRWSLLPISASRKVGLRCVAPPNGVKEPPAED